MVYNDTIATLERAFIWGMKYMDDKEFIIKLLDKADERKLKLILCYVKALLGLK